MPKEMFWQGPSLNCGPAAEGRRCIASPTTVRLYFRRLVHRRLLGIGKLAPEGCFHRRTGDCPGRQNPDDWAYGFFRWAPSPEGTGLSGSNIG
jgi:hypothetical protein